MNIYKGPMDKAKGGGGRVSGGEKMETTVLEQQQQKIESIESYQ